MAQPTSEEIQAFYEEETEYTTVQEDFEDNYADIVEAGNAEEEE